MKYAPAATELPPYSPYRRCPKCNHDQVTTTHYAAECTDDGCSTCDREHLRRMCQRCKHQWAEATAAPATAAPSKPMVSVADPVTEQMRHETGHDCIACPTRVRDLMATAHNLLVRLDASDWSSIPRKRESLRESLAQIQPFSDAHFAALEGWRRPMAAREPSDADPGGRAAEANQDSDGEAARKCSMAGCSNPQAAWGVCGEHMPDIGRDICAEENPAQPGEICWKPSSHGAVEGTPCSYAPASQIENEADDLDQASTETPEHTEAVYDDGAAKLRKDRATGGIMSSPAAGSPIVITTQQPPSNVVQAVRDEIADAIRRQGGTTGLTFPRKDTT